MGNANICCQNRNFSRGSETQEPKRKDMLAPVNTTDSKDDRIKNLQE
jgi:hypothetical protein